MSSHRLTYKRIMQSNVRFFGRYGYLYHGENETRLNACRMLDVGDLWEEDDE